MKLNIFAVASIAFFSPSCHAAPSTDPLQIKLSIDVPAPAIEAPEVLLVFAGIDPGKLGDWYFINTTVDGTKFDLNYGDNKVSTVTQYYYRNCTVNTKDGRSFSLINYGRKHPVFRAVVPPAPFIGGSCSPPYVGGSDDKIGL